MSDRIKNRWSEGFLNDMRFRPMLEADAEQVATILRETGWFNHMVVETVNDTALRIKAQIALYLAGDSHSAFVAEASIGDIVGYAAIHWLPSFFLPGPEGYLSDLFVSDAYRGKSVGRKLLDAINSEARRRNCYRLSLWTNRRRESYQRGFYSKLGWVERESIANFVLEL